MLGVERATSKDLEQLVGIPAARRVAYAEYQPQFWRPAPDAVHRQRDIGRIVPAPPVYDPGGATCMVDDFAVADHEWLTIGPLLLDALRSWANSRGAAQMIVVTAHLDEAKRAALEGEGLTIASEWWVGAIDG